MPRADTSPFQRHTILLDYALFQLLTLLVRLWRRSGLNVSCADKSVFQTFADCAPVRVGGGKCAPYREKHTEWLLSAATAVPVAH